MRSTSARSMPIPRITRPPFTVLRSAKDSRSWKRSALLDRGSVQARAPGFIWVDRRPCGHSLMITARHARHTGKDFGCCRRAIPTYSEFCGMRPNASSGQRRCVSGPHHSDSCDDAFRPARARWFLEILLWAVGQHAVPTWTVLEQSGRQVFAAVVPGRVEQPRGSRGSLRVYSLPYSLSFISLFSVYFNFLRQTRP